MAYEVLGDLVAKVSGQSIEDYVDVHILQSLTMTSSTKLLRKADPGKLAAGHTKGTQGSMKIVKHYPYNRAHTPSSNLHSNVDDMARWTMANLNRGELEGHRILKYSTYDVMWKQYAQKNQNAGVGISWFLTKVQGQKAVVHNGGDDGFVTRLVLFPERRTALVYMLNCDVCKPGAFDGALLDAALGR
jgi:CubicO group peptidase (beta-lactamase class C family)